jgi:hypothetical protein
MPNKKAKKKTDDATRARVSREMARPRMARSARIAKLKLDHARIPERPSATIPGIVEKIIPPPRPSKPGQAQIDVEEADRGYLNLRIENTLFDENGDEVKLKKGDRVEVTVTEDPNT